MRIDSSHFLFSPRLIAITAAALGLVSGCVFSEEQQLVAQGELVRADGRTPVGDTLIEQYSLTFSFASDGGGTVDIRRAFSRDESGNPIVTDANGKFRIEASNLALAYDWEAEEQVCDDVCVTWDTVCTDVSEEVCDTCTEQECWDDCTEECVTECWDEKVCDEYGDCWIETVCEDDCADVCQTVCEPVDYDCNCRWETYEQCDEQCTESASECEWVTQTYTSYPALREITRTRATVWTRDGSGGRNIIVGDTIEQQTGLRCDNDSTCWLQTDRFVFPAAE